MEKLIIIDGNNVMYRAFYALPPLRNFNGEISNGVFGFTNMLIKIINEQKPNYIVVAFDKGKNTFRHKMFKDYKAQRKPTPVELIGQFPILKDLLTKMGIKYIELDDIEADDIMGIISRKFNTENIILSADRDVLQLVNENTSVMSLKKGITETILYTQNNMEELLGIKPFQIIELKSLMGDASDNIPGVSGVGEKTAMTLIQKYNTLDGVYDNIDEISGKLHDKLIDNKESAYLSKTLATIKLDYDLDCSLDDFKYSLPFNNNVLEIFKKYQFNSLLKRDDLFEKQEEVADTINKKVVKINSKIVSSLAEFNDLVLSLKKELQIAIYLNNEYLSVAYSNNEINVKIEPNLLGGYVSLEDAINSLKDIFKDNKIQKILFDTKKFLHILDGFGIKELNNYYDVILARYLINSNANPNVDLPQVAIENGLNEKMFSSILIELKNVFDLSLEKFKLCDLYNQIELPLVKVLFNMEKQGVKIDTEELDELDKKYAKEISDLTEEIYDFAGCEFNINSPKQMSEVLFDKLNLKVYGKKKGTGVEILNELLGQHDIIPLILRYRQISKLHTTYVVAFKNIVDKSSHKIFTTYNQALTTTGRISSSDPNLQNIPVRSEEGKNIRKMFVSSFENGYIVSSDYSQIELRLLACFSKDEVLINAFNSNEDIHARTASEIFGLPIELVTPEMRRNAKAINFGIIYGISDYGLSQNIGSSVASAKQYINAYFDRYPRIYEYMHNNVDECKNQGYIRTLFNRMRIVPEINSSNYNLRQFGERVAMNMPLQGSASDIIKLAMIRVYDKLKENNLQSKLILQVHDELVVDTAPNEKEQVMRILKEEMENIVDLPVKLKVDVEVGRNWLMVE